MPRYRTLKEIDDAGHDLRLWCYRCQRAAVIGSIIWQHFESRGLSLAIADATPRFPCRQCGARDCLILPASRPPISDRDATELVAGFFHAMRSASKKRDYGSDRIARALIDRARRDGHWPPPGRKK
ncbi:hypothetical protein M9978_08135 [Sphingomonas sp. MG17]|uniref:Uncharacterized protein n=1 Tax=Sphingomonas tagetis TaxID=2949092 RepID=A0A9X2HFY3_9SPHN|nr:hypothetical protein [Sphingomonas tagetis]MCP3730396.1 hypothetical protein [Sphingomonas tagetis]